MATIQAWNKLSDSFSFSTYSKNGCLPGYTDAGREKPIQFLSFRKTIVIGAVFILFAVVVAIYLVGSRDNDLVVGYADNGIYRVKSNTQTQYENIRIGVGNFNRRSYVDETGGTTAGQTCGLWISVRDRPDLAETVTVHVSQVIRVGNYSINVSRIGYVGGAGVIELKITP